jgi:hypothetical protein
VRDADELIAQAERANDLGRTGKQGNDCQSSR